MTAVVLLLLDTVSTMLFLTNGLCTGYTRKKQSLETFATFSATALNFKAKFYILMWNLHLRIAVKCSFIIFSKHTVTDFLVRSPADFVFCTIGLGTD